MKWLYYFCLLFVTIGYSQDTITPIKIKETPLNADQLVGIDNFDTKYYLKGNIFYKKTPNGSLNYSNVQLGHLTSANTFNPLKMVLFYQNFNTVVILDNRLAEVYKIDFNTTQPYRNITHVSSGNDNTLWVFNLDLQQLQLYDYKTKSVRATTLPVVSNVLDLTSNYNYCWLLTEKYLYKYSYFGSLLYKIENKGYTKIKENNDNLILERDQHLLFLDDKTQKITPIKTPELLINQFLVTTETLYIYDSKILHEFQLKN